MPKLDMNIKIDTDNIKKICAEIGKQFKQFAEEQEELTWHKEDCDRYKFETQFGDMNIIFNNTKKKIKVKLDCSGLSDEDFEGLREKVSALRNIIAPKE